MVFAHPDHVHTHGFTYLCSPYSANKADAQLRAQRFEIVCRVAAVLMQRGEAIFCPIAHSHPIELHGFISAPNHQFWLRQDFAILQHASRVKVLMLPGWHESIGIGEELRLAYHLRLPVTFIDDQGNPREQNE